MKPRAISLAIAAVLVATGVLTFAIKGADRTGAAADDTVAALELHLSGFVSSALAQAAAHRLLIDVHTEKGLACTACHGEAAFSEPVAEAKCTACHGTYAELAAKTPQQPNPHQSHMGELTCATCHNIHKQSVSYCDDCHSFGMQVP